MAWAECARAGADDDVAAIVDLVVSGDRVAPFVISELWRSKHPRLRALIDETLSSASGELRAAACDSLGHTPRTPEVLQRLVTMLEDADEIVRESARAALALQST